jgi:hypothetical protein
VPNARSARCEKNLQKTIPIENVFWYSVVALVFETSARELWKQPHKAF